MSENSDSSKMIIDGNETLPSGEMKEASSGEKNSLTKKYSPDAWPSLGIFYRESQDEKDLIEAMSTKEIRAFVRKFKRTVERNTTMKTGKRCFIYNLQQLRLREREFWHKE